MLAHCVVFGSQCKERRIIFLQVGWAISCTAKIWKQNRAEEASSQNLAQDIAHQKIMYNNPLPSFKI